ncbi:MAG: hypothetical protein ABIP55_13810 [Tepidisphaeraceae bacterium]
MLQSEQIEELMVLVSGLDRATLVSHLRAYPAVFPVDFTNDYLSSLPIDKIRHIFVAMCLQSQRLPDGFSTAA